MTPLDRQKGFRSEKIPKRPAKDSQKSPTYELRQFAAIFDSIRTAFVLSTASTHENCDLDVSGFLTVCQGPSARTCLRLVLDEEIRGQWAFTPVLWLRCISG